jgi:hypothetical protein
MASSDSSTDPVISSMLSALGLIAGSGAGGALGMVRSIFAEPSFQGGACVTALGA